ncbi:hypothetical protein QC764_507830 [Podospora pseudoanserina]|uniref:NACHT domain-containing protein n=1 Tax=Podospora pseudoanserina TaxID=2609844 RepID=A0ABR0I6G3_9PEZI|nr:hypothetical protein QC764_507830 [Podospora pseudoanserina]
MDPISAFSLAVNVLSTVDIAVKTGKTLWDLYKSTSGFTKQTDKLLLAMSQFDAALGQLANPRLDASARLASERCSATIKEIRAMLDLCKARKPSSVASALQAKAQYTKHKSELQDLQKELESATGQLRTALAITTNNDVSVIKQLLAASEQRSPQLITKLEAISQKLDPLEELTRLINKSDLQTVKDALSLELAKLTEKLDLLQMIKDAIYLSEASLESMNQATILGALRPATADKRFEEIADPACTTFSWMLGRPSGVESGDSSPDIEDPARVNASQEFLHWLRSGSGIYHIAGKPGAGKSTLMKYLATHSTTQQCLESWAASGPSPKQLICSRFFFWKIGTAEQKTTRGLLRGIIYDILRGNSELTSILFPDHWAPRRYAAMSLAKSPIPTISDTQINNAVKRLLTAEEISARFKICLFIDGLDEFDEPSQSLWAFCDRLGSWAKHRNVKLCVSSREETPILGALHCAHRITLHHLTDADIGALVHERLSSNPYFQRVALSDTDGRQDKTTRLIIDNAKGVFLWVVFLLKLIEEELPNQRSTSFHTIHRLIETAPDELNEFFRRIFKTIPKHHARGAHFVLAMMLRLRGYCIAGDYSNNFSPAKNVTTSQALTLFGLSYIFDSFDNCQHNYEDRPFLFPVPLCSNEHDYRKREIQTAERLQSWCKGLIEVRTLNSDRKHAADFTHRSVSDFLCTELRDLAPNWKIDDDWVAEGILTTYLAEFKALSFTQTNFTPRKQLDARAAQERRLPAMIECLAKTGFAMTAPPASWVFTLLDEIDAFRQYSVATDSSTAEPPKDWFVIMRGDGFQICHPENQPGSLFAIATDMAAPMLNYVMWRLQDPRLLGDDSHKLLTLASIVSGTRKQFKSQQFMDVSPILRALLERGLSPNVGYPQIGTREVPWFSVTEWRESLTANRQDGMAIGSKSPWRDTLSIFIFLFAFSYKGAVPVSIWNELQVWLEFGAEVPAEVLVIPLATSQYWAAVGFRYPTERAEIAVWDCEDLKMPRKEWLMGYFATIKSTTLSSMIRWHQPHNMHTLSVYTDPMGMVASDSQEWKPPFHQTAPTFIMHDRNQHLCPVYPFHWIYGLVWEQHLRQWVRGDPSPLRDWTSGQWVAYMTPRRHNAVGEGAVSLTMRAGR